MKITIGMMFQNEADWLDVHLPVLTSVPGIALVGLDGGSTDDSRAVFESFGGIVYDHPYPDLSQTIIQHNKLIDVCRAAGFDGMIKLDPDELLFPEHIQSLATLLKTYQVLRIPTYNFVSDRYHYCPTQTWYPDWHERAWRLDCPVCYINNQHSIINWQQHGLRKREDNRPTGQYAVLDVPHIHLYHYGDTKDRTIRALRSLNLKRRRQGLPMLATYLADKTIPPPVFRIPFTGPQPLDPDSPAVRALYKTDRERAS